MTRTVELTPLLKSLKLGALAATLPERIALARLEQLDYASFLEIILSDEVNRRARRRTELRLQGAGFEETCRPGRLRLVGVNYPGSRLLDAVCSLEFLDKHEHVLLVGPAGAGKSFLAQASAIPPSAPDTPYASSTADGFSGPWPRQSGQLSGPHPSGPS